MKSTNEREQTRDGEITDEVITVSEITSVPVFRDTYISPNYVIALCHGGTVECEYDYSPQTYRPHDIAIVYPNHSLYFRTISPDYRATQVSISASFYEKMSRLQMSRNRAAYEHLPHFTLTDSQYDDVKAFFDALRRIVGTNIDNKEIVLHHCVYIITHLIDSFYEVNVGGNRVSSRLSRRFYNAVIDHHVEHRDLQFYANLFCLTPNHFSSVIKKETGHPATFWIQRHVANHAKQMIINDPEMSMQELADRLGFPDQSSFSRYFKHATGLPPSSFQHVV